MQAPDILRVNEIFYSIQGEGRNTGLPAVFVRLSGCNRSCHFCDTKYHADTFREMTADEILVAVEAFPTRNVILTGGEPTIQNLDPLWLALSAADYWTAIETNGDRFIGQSFDWITVSPKERHILGQDGGDELKVVWRGEDVDHYLEDYPNFDYYFLQPCSGKNIRETAEYVKRHPKWRLSLQCQKLISIR